MGRGSLGDGGPEGQVRASGETLDFTLRTKAIKDFYNRSNMI